MRSLMFFIAVVSAIGWVLGCFVYDGGKLIHILLVLAVLSLLIGIFKKNDD